ncbi:hypothetical protein [Shewanella sp. YIC-542]|uniref:hypothetical protein n=1 Tax=Shewanella mytili TaxID=3377111 RepID=UPI00398F8A75
MKTHCCGKKFYLFFSKGAIKNGQCTNCGEHIKISINIKLLVLLSVIAVAFYFVLLKPTLIALDIEFFGIVQFLGILVAWLSFDVYKN